LQWLVGKGRGGTGVFPVGGVKCPFKGGFPFGPVGPKLK